MTQKSKARFEFAGWILFTLSAAFFTVSSLKSGDLSAIAGSLFFLVACFVFMHPLWMAMGAAEEEKA